MQLNYHFAIFFGLFVLLQNQVHAQKGEFGNYYVNPDYSDVLAQEKERLFYSDVQFRITIHPDTLKWLYETENLKSDYEFKAMLRVSRSTSFDEILEDVGFRLRGNTSRFSKKKSFKLDINEHVSGRRLFGVKSINLNGEHNDPSLMRAKLSWKLLQIMGLPASMAEHAEVYINDNFYGVYLNVEHIDDEFLKARFKNHGGNLYKCLWPADLTWRGEDPENYKFEVDGRRAYELKTNEEFDDYTDLRDFIHFLEFSNEETFSKEIEDKLAVDGLLRWLAVDILTGNWDNYWHNKNNFYLYHDPVEQLFHFIPYDYDNTFGIAWDDIGWANQNPYTWTPTQESRKLVTRVLAIPEYKNRLTFYINLLLEEIYQVEMLEGFLNRWKDDILTKVAADTFRTLDYGYSLNDFERSFTESTGGHDKYGIRPFIQERIASLQTQLIPGPLAPWVYKLDPKIDIGYAVKEQTIATSHFSTIIFWQVMDDKINTDEGTAAITFWQDDELIDDASYPLSIQSVINDGQAFMVGVDTKKPIEYAINLTDSEGNHSRYPRNLDKRFVFKAFSQNEVVINEFMADNNSTNAGISGYYEDWIELYNPTDSTVSLSNYSITDNKDKPEKFHLSELVIEPNQYLIIWADDETSKGFTHANFKLSKNGEFLGIWRKDTQSWIDTIEFGPQTTDLSLFRIQDGANEWIQGTPSPNHFNTTSARILDSSEKPSTSQITSIYPNPFNPQTTIDFTLSKTENLQLDVFDVLGRHVQTLMRSERQAAGTYSVRFDGNGLASGVYLVRLLTPDKQHIQKLVLLK